MARLERAGFGFGEEVSNEQRQVAVLVGLLAQFLGCAETGKQPSLELRSAAEMELCLWASAWNRDHPVKAP